MGTTAQKLNKILETKEAIRTAINNKGGTLTTTDTFASYSSAIDSLPSGGNTLKTLLDATKSCYYLFYEYQGTSANDLISYSDTENVTSMESMFYQCSSLTSIPQLDTSKVTNMYGMFASCPSLTSIPQLDTSKVTNMTNMFAYCLELTSVPQLDTSKVTNMYGMFQNCSKLEEIHMIGMKVNFNISYSTKFTESALVEILNNLATVTSTQTLTMGSTNLAKLTNEEKAIATNKGRTLE